MLYKNKMQKMFLAAIAIVFISISPAKAGLLSGDSLPVPFATEETKKEVRRIAGSQYYLTYYISNLGVDEIKNFYRANLPALGWQEKGLLDNFSQTEALKNNSSLTQVLEKTLVFEKEKELVIINFIPSLGRGKQTQFSLSRGRLLEMPENAAADADALFVPQLVVSQKKNIVPNYPGASLMFLSEPENSQRAVYVTKDDVERVAAFFKEKMPGYGWALQEENPAVKVESAANQAPENCPTCAKAGFPPVETWIAKLKFSKQGAEECEIVFSYIKATDKMPQALAATTIVVNYEKRK